MTDREAEQLIVDGAAVEADEACPVVTEHDAGTDVVSRGGCLTDRAGWAGAHLHGAVRPRRRAAGRGRPPGRWC